MKYDPRYYSNRNVLLQFYDYVQSVNYGLSQPPINRAMCI